MEWKKPTCALLVAMLISGVAMVSVSEVTYAAILDVTVATDKPNYYLGENVTIHGNLTLGGSPYEGLVALEVDDPNYIKVIRTLQTGAPPPPGNITIVTVYPCNMWGDPQNSFSRGEIAYFSVSVRNDGTTPVSLTITINVYDKDMVPIVAVSVQMPLAQGTGGAIMPTLIPAWAALGNGTAHANLFTNWPKAGGFPYCPEKSATFNITDGSQGGGTSQTPSSQNFGNYSLTFKLPTTASAGIYRVYASASYQGLSATSNTVFGVNAIYVPDSYPTIQGAVNAATPTNNSILVSPGTYNEHVTINKPVKLIGINPSNTVINGGGTGTVVTVTANNVEISRFTIQNGGGSFPDSGIILNNSSNCTISQNIILNNYSGIYLTNSSQQNIIQDNTLTSNNGYGINIYSSNSNDILGNTVSNNKYGIYMNQSANTALRDNLMICNKYNFGIFGDSISHFTHNVDTSNTVDGKPIIYWINQYDGQVPSNAGFVAIVDSTNITVRGLNLTKNGQGVLFAFTYDSLIERVNTINNEYGIYLVDSGRNMIIGSSVSNNSIGIYQNYCNENVICHNNFINNTQQVYNYSSTNTWYDTAGKGNHWSDYTGKDDGSGNRTAGDDVGDTLLPHQGVDWYPLMNPRTPVHDIAVTSVTYVTLYNSSQVYPGWNVNITFAIKNEGDFTEAFNVSAYYGVNFIQIRAIAEMIPQSEITLNLTWNTKGVFPGNYTIKVTASEIYGETDTADNTHEDGEVCVRKFGDVNSDGRITIADVKIMDNIYSMIPGLDPSLIPYGDLNGDGRVTIADVKIMDNIYSGVL